MPLQHKLFHTASTIDGIEHFSILALLRVSTRGTKPLSNVLTRAIPHCPIASKITNIHIEDTTTTTQRVERTLTRIPTMTTIDRIRAGPHFKPWRNWRDTGARSATLVPVSVGHEEAKEGNHSGKEPYQRIVVIAQHHGVYQALDQRAGPQRGVAKHSGRDMPTYGGI